MRCFVLSSSWKFVSNAFKAIQAVVVEDLFSSKWKVTFDEKDGKGFDLGVDLCDFGLICVVSDLLSYMIGNLVVDGIEDIVADSGVVCWVQ